MRAASIVVVACLLACGREKPLDGNDAGSSTPALSRALAIAGGMSHACALLDNHRVKCWGNAASGQLGYGDGFRRGAGPGEMGNGLPFVDLGTGRTATAIAAGGDTTCAILDDGSVKCWGDGALTGLPGTDDVGNGPGQMGDALPALDLGAGRTATRLVVSSRNACALLDDGTARCWGADAPARVPTAVPFDGTRPVRALAPAGYAFIVLYQDGSVAGMLPVELPASWDHGIATIGGNGPITAEAMAGVACVAPTEGGVQCVAVGAAFPGYLDAGDAGLVDPALAPQHPLAIGVSDSYPCLLLEGGDVQCARAAIEQPPCRPDWCVDFRQTDSVGHFRVNLGQPAVAITTGALAQTCALLANGAVRCFGLWSDSVPNDALGSSFDLTEANGQNSWGPFHDIDLGTTN